MNYPGKEIVLKQNIQRTLYELVEYIYSYSINQVIRVKEKYLKDFIVKLAMIDFYTNMSYELKIITKKQVEVLGRNIIEIRKMAYGLVKSNEAT